MEMASLNSIRKVKESAPLWVSASSSNEAVNGVGVGVGVGVGGGWGVGPAEIRPVARAVLVDRLDPVHVAALRLHVGIRVAGRRRAGVGVYFYELARIVDGAVAPEYLIVGDGAVGGVLPCEGNRIVRRRDDDSRGLIGNGALLRPHRIRAGGGEGQHDDAYGQRSQNGEPDKESGPTGESHRCSSVESECFPAQRAQRPSRLGPWG